MHLLRILSPFILAPALILTTPLPQGEGSTACSDAVDNLEEAVQAEVAANTVCIKMSVLLLNSALHYAPTVN